MKKNILTVERDTALGSHLSVRVRLLNGALGAVLDCSGYLDNENTPKFLIFCREVFLEKKVLGLNLESLSYISSTGVGAFSSLGLEARHDQKLFFITGVPDSIKKVLSVLGFRDLIRNIDDIEDYDFGPHYAAKYNP